MKNIFEGIKKVHLIGIGGIGMSGIAEYLVRKDYEVTGSDMTMSLITGRLENLNIKCFEGHNDDHLPDDTELVIYSAAVKEDNPEFIKAKRLNKKIVKRAVALGSIVNDKYLISVSGTHGKTTTTAMIAKILIENGIDPTIFVGGLSDFLDGGSSRIGNSNIAVVEADEYDRSFLQLKSDIIVITSIEEDHLDIYEDLNDIKNCFVKFVECSKENVNIIACGDDQNVRDTLKDISNVNYYGFGDENDTVIKETGYGSRGISFRINRDDLRIKVPGDHNVLNSTAAYLVSKEFGVNCEKFNQSMKTFFGVKRRLELKFDNGIKIYDDYAHHPSEVMATLSAVKKQCPGKIITVFQPHLYSRTRDFHEEFGKSFEQSDFLILAKIYPARETEIEGVTSELILNEYLKLKPGSGGTDTGFYFEHKNLISKKLDEITEKGDVIIFMGAGDITEICSNYVKMVKEKSNIKVPL
ncbi:MAG TPA: UDP-N-acetylmuramate--L-alanine ligase [Ignavibacteria bacterium]|nr:UDP-N-acetylmuramate--L-alanine ligase [Ignavibacteria bacterium]HMR39452.1 UDP-N-acetylmuramate--L-alanine ligase [Ignavibacteria bacterium]